MKKIFVLLMCAMLICAVPVSVFAEESATEPVTEEAPITDQIVDYVKSHVEEITVIVTFLAGSLYDRRLRRKLNGSIGTLNNNAIGVANNSADAIKSALEKVDGISGIVKLYTDKIETLMAEIRDNDEERRALKEALVRVESYLATSKSATVEMANEVAELLVLANIPNAKKDELYSRHTKAVHSIAETEAKAEAEVKAALEVKAEAKAITEAESEEVTSDDSTEA